jgi:hypothetical protein
MLYSDYQVHVIGHVPYVGFATYRRVTVRTRFTFCIYKKKKTGCHRFHRWILATLTGCCQISVPARFR